jgi:4-amino-4-deoxy-L-arabinose transferase-like glycosyltransferase
MALCALHAGNMCGYLLMGIGVGVGALCAVAAVVAFVLPALEAFDVVTEKTTRKGFMVAISAFLVGVLVALPLGAAGVGIQGYFQERITEERSEETRRREAERAQAEAETEASSSSAPSTPTSSSRLVEGFL